VGLSRGWRPVTMPGLRERSLYLFAVLSLWNGGHTIFRKKLECVITYSIFPMCRKLGLSEKSMIAISEDGHIKNEWFISNEEYKLVCNRPGRGNSLERTREFPREDEGIPYSWPALSLEKTSIFTRGITIHGFTMILPIVSEKSQN